MDPSGHEIGYAETGGNYDLFTTTNFFGNDLYNPFNLFANFSGFAGNIGLNALGTVGEGIEFGKQAVFGNSFTEALLGNYNSQAVDIALLSFGGGIAQGLKSAATYYQAAAKVKWAEMAAGGEGYLANERGAVGSSNTGKSLSVLRRTGEGEEFVRFESGNPNFTKVTSEGGLKSGTFAAQKTAQSLNIGDLNVNFNLPDPNIARTDMFIIKPNVGTWIEGPRPVIYGTNSEVIFPFGTGQNTVIGPFKTKP